MENYDDYLQDAFENYLDEHQFDEEGLLEELEGEDENKVQLLPSHCVGTLPRSSWRLP